MGGPFSTHKEDEKLIWNFY